VDGGGGAETDDELVGSLVAAAFPDWVARRRPGDRHRYLTASGTGAALPADSSLAGAEWLAVAEIERVDRSDQRIVAAAPIEGTLDELLARRVERRVVLEADRSGTFTARTTWQLGAIVVRSDPTPPDRDGLVDAATALIRERGMAMLRWSEAARQLQQRAVFARSFVADIADCGDDALAEAARDWLPGLLGRTSTVRLDDIDAGNALATRLDWHARRLVDEWAPTHVTIASGRRITVRYTPDGPVVRVRLQDMFGSTMTPSVANGRVAVTLELLSPAGRPLQVTRDLASFWSGSYRQVRAEMRGRYPKHPWPEDPTDAPAR
jgi:ATP-dependent helicase HrpB